MNDEVIIEPVKERKYSLKDTSLLKDYLKYVKPYKLAFLTLLVLDLFVNAIFNIEPLILKYLIDSLTSYSDGLITLDTTISNAVLYLSLDLGLIILAIVGAYIVNCRLKKIGQRIIKDIRDDLFAHILKLDTKSLKSIKIGSFVTRVTNDSQNLSLLFSDILPIFIRSLISLVVIIFTIFIQLGAEGLAYFGLIYLAFLPVAFFLSLKFRKKARVYYLDEKVSISDMNSFLSESFQGVKVIKSYSREDRMLVEFDRKNESIRTNFLKSQHLFSLFYPSMYLLQMACNLIVIGIGIPLVVSGSMLLGSFQMLYSYNTMFFGPIQQLTEQLNMLQNIISSAERIQLILRLEEEKEEKEALEVDSFQGEIEFDHVTFSYVEGQKVLDDISFKIKKGETAAFVGATGAGKSTIINLITRTYIPDSGTIRIDGVDINRYSLDCLRKNIGVMLQDVFLFTGTVEDNITLGDKNITREEVVQSSKEVGADSFISLLPSGYDEKVQERGENFSSGQRQLISFARTLVYKPSLVLLDEATSNIDTETEKIIQDSLERIRKIGTMVIVAHRLSTIKRADIIFVMDKGRLVERGNHQELLKLKGIYYNLYRLQNLEKEIQTQGDQG